MSRQISRILLISIFMVAVIQLRSQEMLGVMNSNFAGVNGLVINPANAVLSDQKININLLAGDFYLSSNYIYIHRKDYGLLKIFRVNILDPQYLYIYQYPEYNYSDSLYYFDYYKNAKPKNIYLNTRILGPSVTWHKGRHAFSLVTGLRTNVSVTKIAADLANFIYRGQQFRVQQNSTYTDGPMRFTELSWAEAGLGYAYTFRKEYGYEMSAGITVKALMGLGAAYGLIGNLTYMIPNVDSIYVYDMNGTFGFSLPINTSDNSPAFSPLIKGLGAGIDIGVTYLKMNHFRAANNKSSFWLQGAPTNYLYRIGLSLIDIGRISFNKLVEVHEYNNVNNALWSGLRTFSPGGLEQTLMAASYNLLGDSTASLTGQTRFGVWLPSAASIQFDYNFGSNIFANATFVQGIRLGSIAVRRPALVSVTPRYETRYFEVNLPVSLFDYRDPQIGLAIRIFNLVIGTEKLGTIMHLTDVNGMDFYFSLGFDLNPKGKTKPCDSYSNYKRYQTN